MSRPIQTSDYVHVTIDDQEYILTITDIHPTYIVADDYVLIYADDHWLIRNHPTAHSIRFVANPLLTYFPEITSQILLSLDYKDLMNACQTNKDFNKVCQDDYFWKLKVEHDYGAVTEDKPLNITYRQQYIDLMTINNPRWAAEKGRLDILQLLAQNHIDLDQYGINWAAAYGQLKILKWLAQTRNIYPDQLGAIWAAGQGQLDVLKWLAQTKNIYPSRAGADLAGAFGHVKVLEWLARHGIHPN